MQNRITKKLFKRILLISAGLFLLLVVGLLLSLNTLLQNQIDKVKTSFEKNYDAKININGLSISGLGEVEISKLEIQKNNLPKLVDLNDIKLNFSLLSLLKGKPKFKSLKIKSGNINYIGTKDSINIPGYITINENIIQKSSLTGKLFGSFSKLTRHLPGEIELSDIQFRIKTNKDTLSGLFNADVKNETLDTKLTIEKDIITAKGQLDLNALTSNIVISTSENFNFTKYGKFKKWSMLLCCPKINLEILDSSIDPDETQIDAKLKFNNLKFSQKKITRDTLLFNQIEANFKILSEGNSIQIDSSSTLSVNNFESKLFTQLFINESGQKSTEQDTSLTIKVNIPRQKAQNFFTALPENTLSNFKGIQTSGDFEYKFEITHIFGKPDSLSITSDLKPYNFRVKKYGKTDFRIINSNFTHHPYRSSRTLSIGEGNPGYLTYDQIPEMMIQSVINSEDGTYFYHKGFNFEAIKASAIEDLKTKSFRRGGSTLTMQLVKNIFLNHQKNLLRKLEEIIIVWMIENLNLSSKKRMLEVYLNIIEWGPGIYGINEAAQFYFYKSPSQLELEECLFLAMIISHPKSFGYHFDKNGFLREENELFFDLVGQKLVAIKVISQDKMDAIKIENVALSANARKYLSMDENVQRFTKREIHNQLKDLIKKSSVDTNDEAPDESIFEELKEE